jgi:hypothetical protein
MISDVFGKNFPSLWSELYGETPPIGHLLRAAFPERWLRLHSLPAAKRSPDSGWDYSELLRRHNTAAAELLGSEGSCVLIAVEGCSKAEDTLDVAGTSFPRLPDELQPPDFLWDPEEGEYAERLCFYGGQIVWRPGAYDGLILATARDDIRCIIVSVYSGAVYAPYDGGMDLFFPSVEARDRARERYAQWVSPRVDGL